MKPRGKLMSVPEAKLRLVTTQAPGGESQTCLDENQVVGLIQGLLSEHQLQQLEGHIDRCERAHRDFLRKYPSCASRISKPTPRPGQSR